MINWWTPGSKGLKIGKKWLNIQDFITIFTITALCIFSFIRLSHCLSMPRAHPEKRVSIFNPLKLKVENIFSDKLKAKINKTEWKMRNSARQYINTLLKKFRNIKENLWFYRIPCISENITYSIPRNQR